MAQLVANVEENILRFCTFAPSIMQNLGPKSDPGLNYPSFIDGARVNFPTSFKLWLKSVCETRTPSPSNLNTMINWIDNCTYEEEVISTRNKLIGMIPADLCGEYMNSFFLTATESDLKTMHVPLMFLFGIKRNQDTGDERTVFALTFAIIPLDDDPNNPNPLLEKKYIFNINGVCGELGAFPLYAFLFYKAMFEYIFNYANIETNDTIREMVILLAALIGPLAGYVRAGLNSVTTAGINPIYRDFAIDNFKEYVDNFDDHISILEDEINRLPPQNPRRVKLIGILNETIRLKTIIFSTSLYRGQSGVATRRATQRVEQDLLASLVMPDVGVQQQIEIVLNPVNPQANQALITQLNTQSYEGSQSYSQSQGMAIQPLSPQASPLIQEFHSLDNTDLKNISVGVTNAPKPANAPAAAAAAAAVSNAVDEYRVRQAKGLQLAFEIAAAEAEAAEEEKRREAARDAVLKEERRGRPEEINTRQNTHQHRSRSRDQHRSRSRDNNATPLETNKITRYVNSLMDKNKIKKLAEDAGYNGRDVDNIEDMREFIIDKIKTDPYYRYNFYIMKKGGTTKKRRNKRSGRKTRKTTKKQRNNKTKNRKRYRQKSKRNR